jgi:serine/arginine repetitive matrix protein 1
VPALQTIDPRILQINLTGFLEKNTSLFCKVRPRRRPRAAPCRCAAPCAWQSRAGAAPPCPQELWTLLISAASSGSGIPQKFLDDKAEEERKRREEEERIQARTASGSIWKMHWKMPAGGPSG